MTTAWQEKYVRTVNGEPMYTSEVYFWTDASILNVPCWDGLLYNYTMGMWEAKAQECGYSRMSGGGRTDGWTMWESYHLASWGCPVLPSIRAMGIRTRGRDGYYSDLYPTQTNASGPSCFTAGTYQFVQSPSGSNSWKAKTPNE